jgi:ABC-2 type transport system permease protein
MRVIYVALFAMCILLTAAVLTAQQSRRIFMQEQLQAEVMFRHQWETLQIDNAHGAAHYGTYIFQPASALSAFDKGITDFTGNIYRIEAHKQHGFLAAPLPASGIYARFGSLTAASVLQLFLPLFLIFICFDIYSKERESGTLSLLLLQGAGSGLLLTGKAIVAVLLALALLLTAWTVLMLTTQDAALLADAPRTAGLISAYILYAIFFSLLSVMISFIVKRSGAVLLILLSVWLLMCLLLPRILTATSEGYISLPSHFSVQKKMSDAEKFGLDGKSPRAVRMRRFNDSLLHRYAADSLSRLPVNAAALWMQAAEDYGEQIYERYMGEVDSLIDAQNEYTAYGRYLNPFIAVREISMALSGTDLAAARHFQQAARRYRNDFIRQLNGKLAARGKVTADFYRRMSPFIYTTPSAASVFKRLLPAFFALCIWVCIPIAGLFLFNRYRSPLY